MFEDPTAKYKNGIKTLPGRLHSQTLRIEKLERDRKRDLATYWPRVPRVTEVREELEMQRQLARAYANELATLSGDIEQTPTVKGLRNSLSKLRTKMSALKQEHGTLSAKNTELACLAEKYSRGTEEGGVHLRRRGRCTRRGIR